MGIIKFLGEPGRGQVFLPAALVMVILGLPMIFWLKEPRPKTTNHSTNFKSVYRETFQGLKALIRENKNVALFLFSFMFISDALLTANLYFAIYLDQIFGMTDIQKYIALGLMEIVAIASSYIAGKMSDRIGIKKLFLISIINLTLTYGFAPFVSSIYLFYMISAFIGLGYGAFYTTSRALLIKISPPNRLGEYFGFSSTFQRFASIIGPLTWSGVTLLLRDYGTFKYRAAIFSLSLLMLIGLILAIKVKEKSEAIQQL
jgi:UMF1 family MFS transporter